jgi:hypothetical protein
MIYIGFLVCADDVNILGRSVNAIEKNTEALIFAVVHAVV